MSLNTEIDQKTLEEIEKKYDTSLNTRENGPKITQGGLLGHSRFRNLSSLDGRFWDTPVDYVHMGIHLSGLFLYSSSSGFHYSKARTIWPTIRIQLLKPGNIPLYDWVFR